MKLAVAISFICLHPRWEILVFCILCLLRLAWERRLDRVTGKGYQGVAMGQKDWNSTINSDSFFIPRIFINNKKTIEIKKRKRSPRFG
jgi:hypothetical protein